MCEVKQVAGNGFYTSSNYEKYVTDETYHDFVRSDVQENDILFVTVGATFGKTCLVPENPDFFIAQNLVGFRCKNDIDPKFLMLLLSSAAFKEAMSATNKSSTIDNIKVSDLIKTRVAIPDLVEQKIISTRLFKMLGRFDEIKQKSQAASRLLNERRTALISAAVTGKIDVRNQVPQDVEEAVAS